MSEATRLTNLEVTGGIWGNLTGYVQGDVIGNLHGLVNGPMKATTLSKSANYILTPQERAQYIGATFTAASKTLTLSLDDGTAVILVNEGGANAFTCKNVAGDSGTSIAAGKAYLVKASKTANATVYTALN